MNTSWPFPNAATSLVKQRERMVQNQLVARGIHDRRVVDAMSRVPREEFVPQQLQSEAYEDWPLPIGYGQTISQPYTVALMTEALQLEGPEKVVEIGTGSGYAAAVLACLANKVHTVERIPLLAQQAERRLARLGFGNVQVHTANGTLGLPTHAPFDGIVVTAGAEELPKPYVQQLAVGGRIVIPIGKTRNSQVLYRFTRRGRELDVDNLGRFAFVPLIGEYGWYDVQKGVTYRCRNGPSRASHNGT